MSVPQISEIHVVNGTPGIHLIDRFAHCCPPLFAQSHGRGGSISISVPFYIVGTCTVSCFQRCFYGFTPFPVVCTYVVPFFTDSDLFISIWLGSPNHREKQWPISIQKCHFWLWVRPHDKVLSFIDLCHMYLQRSRPNDIQSVDNGLQIRSKHQKNTVSLEAKPIQLLTFVSEPVGRVVGSDVPQVVQQQPRHKPNWFISV